jgi:alpha-glucoside transport system substrate-binding protein
MRRPARTRRPGNRTLAALGVCLVLLVAGGVVAVRATAWNGSVTLLANWAGLDEQHFRQRVIVPFEDKEHIHVLYQGSSAESQVLKAGVESGTPPDIAVLPGPAELADYAALGQLQPLDGLVHPQDFDAPWAPRVPGKDGRSRTYWVPIKTDLKSIVWYPSTMTAAQRQQAGADPGSWCLGMGSGATSGWPGTDWVEDILLQQAGASTYQAWATDQLPFTDPAVRRAWTTWGAMVGAGRGRDVKRALTTDYDQASAGVVAKPGPTCRLEHQSSFVRDYPAWKQAGAAYVPSGRLIPGATTVNAWEVSGDLAAMLTDTPQARKLIAYLARADVQKRWSPAQSGFSADRQVPLSAYDGTSVAESIARTLRDPHAERCYDASDAMPSKLRDAFEIATLRFLADPAGLDVQLRALEKIRLSKGKDDVWLPSGSVCGSG